MVKSGISIVVHHCCMNRHIIIVQIVELECVEVTMVSDMISRETALEVIEAVKSVTWSQSGKVLCGRMYSQIKDLPAVAPIACAYWQRGYGDRPTCSRCASTSKEESFYCPWCGAYMQGGEEDGK